MKFKCSLFSENHITDSITVPLSNQCQSKNQKLLLIWKYKAQLGDAVPGDSSRPRRKERRRTQAEAQEAGAGGQCDRKLRRGLEEEGGVCRGGSNGRERGGGRSGHVTRIV